MPELLGKTSEIDNEQNVYVTRYDRKRCGKEAENHSKKVKESTARVKAMENDVFVTIAFIFPHKPRQTACVGFNLFYRVTDSERFFRAAQGETRSVIFSRCSSFETAKNRYLY